MSKRQNFYYEIRWSQTAPTIYSNLILLDHIEKLLTTHDMAAAKQVILEISQRDKNK